MKTVLLAVAVLAGLSAPALARTVEERLIAGLKDQGYAIIEDGYTFLGRLRIVAENDTYHREIVVNPGTGEVLRDYAVLLTDLPPAQYPPSESHSSGPAVAAVTTGTSGTASVATDGTGIAAMATGTGTEGAASQSDLLLAKPVLPLGPVAP